MRIMCERKKDGMNRWYRQIRMVLKPSFHVNQVIQINLQSYFNQIFYHKFWPKMIEIAFLFSNLMINNLNLHLLLFLNHEYESEYFNSDIMS